MENTTLDFGVLSQRGYVMGWKTKEVVPVLLVEDDDDDIAITKRAFEKGRILNPLFVVRDGEEALEFLRHTGRYGNGEKVPRPGLILLDLNMPRMDGRQCLKIIKEDPSLRRIPVVVLTTSREDEDIIRSYDDGANTFISKPVEFDAFLGAVVTIGRYWLVIAEIPDNGE